jgi:SAM-dependent methyltransferase
MALTQSSPKFWAPNQRVLDYLTNEVIAKDAKVLDVGPGHAPFKRANVSVDFVDVPGVANLVKCDLANEPLPFADKEFDFVYARHILEDMFNPFPLIKEMQRVGKAGYIECPSPIAELGRGVDGGSPPFRGFHHHRYITWMFGKELRLISKYPFVEYLKFDDAAIDKMLAQDRYWNTYCCWEGEITFAHRQSPLNFDIPRDYALILNEAMERSKEATDIFFSNIK